jgi:hypothetical protein
MSSGGNAKLSISTAGFAPAAPISSPKLVPVDLFVFNIFHNPIEPLIRGHIFHQSSSATDICNIRRLFTDGGISGATTKRPALL